MPISMSQLRAAGAVAVVVGAAFAIQAFAMSLDRAPPQKVFVREGQTYRWSVAHGLTGSLAISGPIHSVKAPPLANGATPLHANGGNMYLVLACSGLTSGAVQARFFAPAPNTLQLRVRTAEAVFRVRPAVETLGDLSFVGGRGDLPDGYFHALATTPTVSVEYAGQVATFPGPGKALAEHFGRYCKQLSQRASHDE